MHVPYILYIVVVCMSINCQKSPKCVGTRKLGCQLVESVLYVSKFPVTADGKVSTSATGFARVDCTCYVSNGTRGEGSCCEAAPKLPPKSGFEQESAVADHHKQGKAMLASNNDVVARLGTLAVEPMFLPRVH